MSTSTPRQISVSLREWISLSASYEYQEIENEEVLHLYPGHESYHGTSSHDSHREGSTYSGSDSSGQGQASTGMEHTNPPHGTAAAAQSHPDDSEINILAEISTNVAGRCIGGIIGNEVGVSVGDRVGYANGSELSRSAVCASRASINNTAHQSYLRRGTYVALLLVNCLQDILSENPSGDETKDIGASNQSCEFASKIAEKVSLDNFIVSVHSEEVEGDEVIAQDTELEEVGNALERFEGNDMRSISEQHVVSEETKSFCAVESSQTNATQTSWSEEDILLLMEGEIQVTFTSRSPASHFGNLNEEALDLWQSNKKGYISSQAQTGSPSNTINLLYQNIGFIFYHIFSRGNDPPNWHSSMGVEALLTKEMLNSSCFTIATTLTQSTTMAYSAKSDIRGSEDVAIESDASAISYFSLPKDVQHGNSPEDGEADESKLTTKKGFRCDSQRSSLSEETNDGAYCIGKERRQGYLDETSKSFQKMRLSNPSLQEPLMERGVPSVICQLISDLLLCGGVKESETTFESIEEISAELGQILGQIEECQHPLSQTYRREHLHFENVLLGRNDELNRLFEVAARVPIESEQLMSNVVMVQGHSGMGKSLLVKSVEEPLVQTGWLFLECKFDRLASQPVSIIASAFEIFFRRAATVLLDERDNTTDEADSDETETIESVVNSVRRNLSSAGIVILSELIPSFRMLFPGIFSHVVGLEPENEVSDGENEVTNDVDTDLSSGVDDGIWGAETIRNRLHYHFRRLVHAMSSNRDNPVLLFVDDLHWADKGGLDLLSSFVIETDFLQQFEENHNQQHLLLVGSYRSEEVCDGHTLLSYIKKFQESNSVRLTNILLDGLSKVDITAMVSKTLGLPVRHTRCLAGTIQRKTLGNPFHVQTLVKSLVKDKILWYSLAEQRWMWQLEVVKSVAIEDTVVELIKKNLLELNENSHEALKVVSCFGSQMDETLLHLVQSSPDLHLTNFLEDIEFCVGENILERRGTIIKFAHDNIAHAAYDLMVEQEKGKLHFLIGMQLLAVSSDQSEVDPITLTALNQINKANAFGVTDRSKAVEFASLNLKAGDRSRALSDFSSSLSYLKCGISFLPEQRWETNYDLCLHLYESASLACFTCGYTRDMSELATELLNKSKCFEDKLKCYLVVIQAMGSLGELDEAVEKSMGILKELGESFPSRDSVTMELVNSEFRATRSIIENITKNDILAAPTMTDRRRIWAMKYMNITLTYLVVVNPLLMHLMSCRLIQVSAQSGFCSDSAFGLMGYCNLLIRHDTEAGYSLGKTALFLLESFNAKDLAPKLRCNFYSHVGFWVEPLQSTSSMLLKTHWDALAVGDVQFSMTSAFFYCRQSFMCGTNLMAVEKECNSFRSKMIPSKQQHLAFPLYSLQVMVAKLAGTNNNPLQVLKGNINNEEQLLHFAKTTGNSALSNSVYFSRLFLGFFFKRYGFAAEMAKNYSINHVVRLMDIYFDLYEGLTAFHLARCTTNNSKWLDIGRKALSTYLKLQKHSLWNFENKLFLLEAESLYCNGDLDLARNKYKESIESARKHRFIHEEGLAMELFGSFCYKTGDSAEGGRQISNALHLFEAWGAVGLCTFLKNYYENNN